MEKTKRKARATKADAAAVMAKKRGPKTRIPGEKAKPRMMRFADSEWAAIGAVARRRGATVSSVIRACLGFGYESGESLRDEIAAEVRS